jgi:hypothetical protein
MKKYIIPITVLLLSMNCYSQPSGWDEYINWAWGGNYSPFIKADVGYGFPGQEDFTGNFSSIGNATLQIGYTELKKYKDFVNRLDERFIFGSYFASDLNVIGNPDPGEVDTKGWQVGIGQNIGYGYEIGPFSLIPYNKNQFTLTNLEFTGRDSLSQSDIDILTRLEGDARFGISTEGGVKLYVAKSVSITTSIEGAVVFPRFVVIHWVGSFALQAISVNIVSLISESIVKSSPIFGPIMYMVLQNAITFAWYYGLKNQQYLPFSSETPFTMETFKLGASITF